MKLTWHPTSGHFSSNSFPLHFTKLNISYKLKFKKILTLHHTEFEKYWIRFRICSHGKIQVTKGEQGWWRGLRCEQERPARGTWQCVIKDRSAESGENWEGNSGTRYQAPSPSDHKVLSIADYCFQYLYIGTEKVRITVEHLSSTFLATMWKELP